MNCLDAQSKIIAYIDHKLDKDERIEFIHHVNYCANCREELNIYYTMIEGMRHLDNNETLCIDFNEELDYRIAHEFQSTKKRTKFLHSSIMLVVILLLGTVVFGYVNFLKLLKEQEQQELKDAQGEYYYSDTFKEVLFTPPDESYILDINVVPKEPEEPSFYEKIRAYHYYQE